MTFCAGCGSPNLDTDATCRVCGRSLSGDATPQPATSSPPQPGLPAATGEPSPAPTASATGVATPSGFESAPVSRHAPDARPDHDLPSFMRPAGRAVTAVAATESASLISEHDLADWIRQIAADDTRKLAEAQVQTAAAAPAPGSSMPSHFGRRALPGEPLTSGPASSSWLSSKDAVAGEAESAWDVTGVAPPSRTVIVPDAVPAQPTASAEARPTRTDGVARGNPRQVYLVAAIIVAVLFMVAMTVL